MLWDASELIIHPSIRSEALEGSVCACKTCLAVWGQETARMQKRCITFSLRGELATATLAVVLELELKVKDFKVPVAVALGLALALASSCFFFSFLQSNFLCPHFLQWEHLSLGFSGFSCLLALA